MICSPRQPLMKLSTLQLESLICMIVQLTTPYTGKLAFNDGVKRPVSTPFVHSSRSVLGISSKRCSSSMLRKFNLFLTIIGTVRFLICSGIRLRLNDKLSKSSLVPLFSVLHYGNCGPICKLARRVQQTRLQCMQAQEQSTSDCIRHFEQTMQRYYQTVYVSF